MTGGANANTEAGQAVYTPLVLKIYDWYVLGLSNRLIWRCPSPRIQAHYDRLLGARHLDVGVGTGYFLDHARFPVAKPAITLFDLNRNSLQHCAARLRRYAPSTVVGDVLEPPPPTLARGSFDSIGLNYLLHCLPGTVAGGKWRVFANLGPLLAAGGVLFGSTILGAGLERSVAQRKLMAVYNGKGIFGNDDDSQAQLERALRASFAEVAIERVGVVALFEARGYLPQ